MTRPFTIETALDRSLEKSARDAEKAELRTRADSAVEALIAACAETWRPYLAVALLERAAEAVSSLHDGPRAQSHLGRVAARHGSELPGGSARSQAERLFRRGGE